LITPETTPPSIPTNPATGPLAKPFLSQNKGPVALLSRKEPTTVAFVVNSTGEWSLKELEYAILDRKGNVAGSFFSPVFIPLAGK